MLNNLKILYHQGKQYIPDVTKAKVPGIFRGRPIITKEQVDEEKLINICPTGAITASPIFIDLGCLYFLWRIVLLLFPIRFDLLLIIKSQPTTGTL